MAADPTSSPSTSQDDVDGEANATAGAPSPANGAPAWWRRRSFWTQWGVVVALGLLLAGFGIVEPGFLDVDNIETILIASSLLVVLALGQAGVVATAGIDLSQGSIVGLSSVVIGQAVSGGVPMWLAMLLGLTAGAVAGAVNGLVIAKGKITDFIVTLGMLSVAFGIGLVLSDGRPVQLIDRLLLELSTGGIGPVRWLVLIAVVLGVAARVALVHRPFGTHLLAVGGDAGAARAMGISFDRVKIAVYTLSGTMAGVAGVMLTARVGAAEPTMQTNLLLNSVASVVLGGVSLFGGRATVVGPVAGAVFLTALTNGLTSVGLGQFFQQIAVGAVVVVSALLMGDRK